MGNGFWHSLSRVVRVGESPSKETPKVATHTGVTSLRLLTSVSAFAGMKVSGVRSLHVPAFTPSMKRHLRPATYIMASGRNGTLYTGSTSNLVQRAWQYR